VHHLPEMLRSERLVLRAWTAHDAELLNAAIATSLDHLRPWMPWAAFEPITVADRVRLIDQWWAERDRGADSVLGAFLGSEIVGGCGLHRRAGPDTLEIGYWVRADLVRRGYATEMARTLTSAAFADPEIGVVEIHHDRANIASAGVPRRLGYSLAAETPDQIVAPGEVGIDCCWRVSRTQWCNKLSHEPQAGRSWNERDAGGS
jgi:ribosomal-protein-serine acetyltransferase